MMDLDPCRSSCVFEVVEEAHEASCMVKKPLEHKMGQITHWSFVVCMVNDSIEVMCIPLV